MHELSGGVVESLVPGTNVLLMGPSFEPAVDGACVDLLQSDVDSLALLPVTFVDSPADRVSVWERYADQTPSRIAFVDVDASVRGVSRSETGEAGRTVVETAPESAEVTVDRVSSPGNLTRLGVAITDRLDELSTVEDRRLVVCFKSVSSLVQYTSAMETFKFLRVLTDRCHLAGAVAHFHLEPAAHDDETVESLRDLFDVVCHHSGQEWTVETS